MKTGSPFAPDPTSDDAELQRLFELGPEAQGDVDTSLLEANLKLTPLQRIEACQRATHQVSQLQKAMEIAHRG